MDNCVKENGIDALIPITPRPELVFTNGKGSWLWDESGKAYLDFIQGWAVNCLGHSPAEIVDSIKQQAERLINPSPGFYNRPMLELASLLTLNSCFDQVFFANSGAEANEGAIKLARKWGQLHKACAYKIISFENGFHGRTLATMSATGKPQWENLYEPKVAGFNKARFNDIESVKTLIDEQTVAVILEPVQGEAGVIPAEGLFLQQLRELCDEEGVLLIFDEVQTGIGRLGERFAYQHYNIEPDIMTLGKGLGGGVPLAALLVKKQYSCFDYGDQGGTFNGNPLMTAVGVAVMKTVCEDQFLARVKSNGELLASKLAHLSKIHGLGKVYGSGLLLALDTGLISANSIVALALDKGLLLNAPRENRLRFMPALNTSMNEIDHMCDMLDEVLGELMIS